MSKLSDDAVVGFYFGGLSGAVFGFVYLWGLSDVPFLQAVALGAVGGVSGALLIVTAFGLLASSKRRAAEQEVARHTAAAEAKERIARRESLGRSIVANADAAVIDFEALPSYVAAARAWTRRAVVTFEDRAFSPFWEAIEAAYGNLGGYTAAARRIENAASRHAHQIAELVAAGGDPGLLAQFPVRVDTARVERTLSAATEELGRLVYQAQKDPVFAQIWEQRRTTAAVVAGFVNLEQAVKGMRSAISSSLQSLASALEQSGREVHLELDRIATDSHAASREQIAQLSALNARADRIAQEAYRQNWGHYPLL
jgi:hypothetical protein